MIEPRRQRADSPGRIRSRAEDLPPTSLGRPCANPASGDVRNALSSAM